jgi:hypothetical protein
VELTVLAAGIDAGRQFGQQPFVVAAPRKAGVEQARIDADERRLEAGGEELLRKRGRVVPPEGEEATLADGGETLFAVGAHILEEQIAEGDRFDSGQRRGCEGLGHAGLVDLVHAGRRDHDLDKRDPEGLRLPHEQLAADAVHADPLVLFGDGRYERLRLEPLAA